MSKIDWDRARRRPVHEPWYSRLDRDPFTPAPEKIKVERLPRRKSMQSAARPKAQSKPHAVVAGAVAGGVVLRTRDIAKARLALCLATSATVWCDGAAVPNPGRMGWGVVVVADGVRVEFFSGGEIGTNNAAEVRAAILALQILPECCSATIWGDSQYLIYGCTTWAPKRKRRLAIGAAVPNAERWRELDSLAAGRAIEWRWCRGHGSDANNNLADRLASYGAGA